MSIDVIEYLQKLESLFKSFGAIGGIGLICSTLGLACLAVQLKTKDGNGAEDTSQKRVEQATREVFGDVSLMERNEEGRTKVSNVIAISKFAGIKFDDKTYNISDFLQDLHSLLSIKKNQKGRVDELRGKLVHDISSPKKFDPPYLKPYAKSLVGMTHFIEGQGLANSREALAWIKPAMDDPLYKDKEAESISNVRGICHAIQMRDASLTLDQRVSHAIEAHKYFVEAIAIRAQAAGSPGTVVRYRFFTNHAEWCIDLYDLIASAPETQKKLLCSLAMQHITDISSKSNELFGLQLFDLKSIDSNDCLALLLKSSCTASEQALNSAESEDLGKNRPAIYFCTVLVGIAVTHENIQRPGGLQLGLSADFAKRISPTGLVENLVRAVDLWKVEMPATNIAEHIQENPITKKWITDIPDLAETYDGVLQMLLKK
jgi:hypothetical protein